MPMRGDVRSATVPGCVDGWLALHERFGRLPLADVLAPARDYAANGFPASPLLARATRSIAGQVAGADDYLPARRLAHRRPGAAPAGGPGAGRHRRGGGVSASTAAGSATACSPSAAACSPGEDLEHSLAQWEQPLRVPAWDRDIWTVPPPSQGYLSLAGARIADGLDLPDDPDDPSWAHLLSEAARWAGPRPGCRAVRPAGRARPARPTQRLDARRAAIDPRRRTGPAVPAAGGGTIHLCVGGRRRDGCFADPVERGRLGLPPGRARHRDLPAEPGNRLQPRPRPSGRTRTRSTPTAHPGARAGHQRSRIGRPCWAPRAATCSPRWCCNCWPGSLRNEQTPGEAVYAPRWSLGDGGFSTWAGDGPQVTMLESTAPSSWELGSGRARASGGPGRARRQLRARPAHRAARRRPVGGRVRSAGDHRGRHRLVTGRRAFAARTTGHSVTPSRSVLVRAAEVDARKWARTSPCGRRASPAPGRSPAPATR